MAVPFSTTCLTLPGRPTISSSAAPLLTFVLRVSKPVVWWMMPWVPCPTPDCTLFLVRSFLTPWLATSQSKKPTSAGRMARRCVTIPKASSVLRILIGKSTGDRSVAMILSRPMRRISTRPVRISSRPGLTGQTALGTAGYAICLSNDQYLLTLRLLTVH